MLDYIIKLYINILKIYDFIIKLFFNIQIVKIKTKNGYYKSSLILYIKFLILNLLYRYDRLLPNIIKKVIKYIYDTETEMIEFKYFNGKNYFNKIIKTKGLYNGIKLFKKYLQQNIKLPIVLPNLINLQSIMIVANNKQNDIIQKDILPKILQYMFQKNIFLYVICFEYMIEEYDIENYSICFEKIDDDLISVKKITIPLKKIRDKTIENVLKEFC